MLVGITKLSRNWTTLLSSRGEDSPPRLDANKYDYLADGEEYAYIYTLNDEWVCYNRYQFEDNRMPEVVEIPAPVAA
jgi:hypothetical protein